MSVLPFIVSDLDRPFCHPVVKVNLSVTRIHHLMIMVSSVSLSPGKGAGSGAARSWCLPRCWSRYTQAQLLRDDGSPPLSWLRLTGESLSHDGRPESNDP